MIGVSMMDPQEEPEDPWARALSEISPEIESKLRKIGVYVIDVGLAPNPHQAHTPEPLPPVFVINATIGDVAWSERVQNPVENRMGVEFRKLEQQMQVQQFEDLQERMRKAVEEGRDPFGTVNEEPDESGEEKA